MGVEITPINLLFNDLAFCYEHYLTKNSIKPDDAFFLDKIYEELGEVTRLTLAQRGMKPGEVPSNIRALLNAEAADLLCQVIIYICHTHADIWPTIKQKWLQELDDDRGTQ